VKSEQIEKVASGNFAAALQGQIAGLNVTSSSGLPGAQANIQIRGTGSFSTGALSPLFVVDGVPFNSMPNFGSEEIESIEVLKDAASASIYGSRASNGVILITTKKGAAGKMRVSLDAYYGITNIRRNVPLIHDTAEWLLVNKFRYMPREGYVTWTALNWNPEGLHHNTNWQDHFQVDNAPMQNYSLRLSGGTNALRYSMTTSYFNQQGLWVNSDFERLSSRANVQFHDRKFTANIGMSFMLSNRNRGNSSLPGNAVTLRPFKAPINPDDEWIPAPGSNPQAIQALARNLKQINRDRTNSGTFNIELGYEIFDGFVVGLNAGGSISNSYNHTFNPHFWLYDEFTGDPVATSEPIASLSNQMNLRTQWNTDFKLDYSKRFGKHRLSLMGVITADNTTRESFTATKRQFPSNEIQTLGAGAIDPTTAGNKYSTSMVGTVGRLQYSYADRYIFQTSVRRDGTSKFGEDNKYGVFPSVSARWNASEETFYRSSSLSNVMTRASLRLSWGTSGNQFIDDYTYIGLISSGGSRDYILGVADQALQLGARQTGFSNRDVKWETTVERNIGVNLGFLKDQITFTGDYYYNHKRDMLFPVTVPPSAGAGGDSSIDMNVGDMENKGFDFTVAYRKIRGDFQFTLTGIFSTNKNKVLTTNLASGTIWGGSGGNGNTTVIREGYEVAAFMLIPTNGLVDTQEKFDEYRKLVSDVRMGDVMFVDVNGDGRLNDDDRVYYGSGTPKWEGGLTFTGSYKKFDLSAQIYGTYGNKIYNAAKRNAYANKRHIDCLNSWTTANPYSTVCVPQGNMSHDNYRSTTDYYLEEGSYLRIRNIQVGYTIPQNLLERARVYLSVDNVFTFTRYTGCDPEVGYSGTGSRDFMSRGVDGAGSMPVTSVYRIGLQVSF